MDHYEVSGLDQCSEATKPHKDLLDAKIFIIK